MLGEDNDFPLSANSLPRVTGIELRLVTTKVTNATVPIKQSRIACPA
jgi:hypothetical protein